jgi:hypothetical protein
MESGRITGNGSFLRCSAIEKRDRERDRERDSIICIPTKSFPFERIAEWLDGLQVFVTR